MTRVTATWLPRGETIYTTRLAVLTQDRIVKDSETDRQMDGRTSL